MTPLERASQELRKEMLAHRNDLTREINGLWKSNEGLRAQLADDHKNRNANEAMVSRRIIALEAKVAKLEGKAPPGFSPCDDA